MTRKLSEADTLKFVQLYRDHQCLWDIRCEAYKNKQMRSSALQQIQEGMDMEGFTIEDVKTKIKSIRSTYYLEVSKIEKSTRSGAGGNVYVPKVKWFEELNSFIRNVAVRRITTDNTQNVNVGPNSPSSENEAQVEQPGSLYSKNECQDARPFTPNSLYGSSAEKLTPPSRSKRSKLSQMASMIKDLKNMQEENMPIGEENEIDIFGKSVASQLKKLSEEQVIIAQEKIQSILCQCRLADIRTKKLNAAQNSQLSELMQQFPKPIQQLPNTQFQWNPMLSTNDQSSFPPAASCALPEHSPSSTATFTSHYKDDSSVSSPFENLDETEEDSSNLIKLAFNIANCK